QCHLGTYSLSAHADEGQLISLAETLDPEHIVLVHGDGEARASLEKALSERRRIVHLPHSGQVLAFQFDQRKIMRTDALAGDLRAHQMELVSERRSRLLDFANSAGKWLLLKGEAPTPVRCLALEDDHLWVEVAPGLEQAAYPEDILAVLGDTTPTEADLAPYRPRSAAPTVMEPNQALALANQHFPPEARLRKAGYRLAEHILVLTFDFPTAALQNFAEAIAALQSATSWEVEVTPEANQSALNALVREVLPGGWQIIKGPAIHREQKRVAVTVAASQVPEEQEEQVCQRFLTETGYDLSITFASPASAAIVFPVDWRGERLEINAAYNLIKSALEGSTLYRTSLKGDEIVLSFISSQVGERYREQINELEEQAGWRLSINPQPNQGAILEVARTLLNKAGWTIVKGPSIYLEKTEVAVSLSNFPEEQEISKLATAFDHQTGFRLVVNAPLSPTSKTQASPQNLNVVEIPLARIRLHPSHQALALDPVKLNKAIERARRMGIAPPIQVRRAREDYVLVDGLYRLRAAEALKLERIPAIVE
ncbi:MAG: ParB N-terminal domain-containing protein, partial [Anaerolineales bacterium]|nr:ParB N-terminal domain-containing protein [Anaerolineales bacterium]